ncbi:MAG: glucose/quinate/shikimate family membrane-bound PQQ-dependent dehydrogenase [Rhizobacter sp.]
MTPSTPTRLPYRPIGGAITALLGLMLLGGGAWLVQLGGSWFYVAAGAVLVVEGLLLALGQRVVLTLHAVLLAATMVWAIWEAGLDWWPIAARADVFVLMAVWLLLPWPRSSGQPLGRGPLAAVLVVSVGVAAASWAFDRHDVAGDLPPRDLPAAASPVPDGEWHAYGRTAFGQRHSPLRSITPDNVAGLKTAWTYRTGDVRGQAGDPVETTFEVTPLKVGNRLFLCTPHQSVIALDATTGAELWRHDPKVKGDLALQHLTCRGVSFHAGPSPVPGDTCLNKLFMPTADARLVALDPETGQPCPAFGGGKGEIDLWANMPNVNPGSYYSTSPVVVTKRLVIVGGTVLDNVSTKEASGVIRAFDVDTGALVWNWDSGNPEATQPIGAGQTYTPNSPNSWSISSVDENLGLVYVPIGNQPPDQWGGKRSAAAEKYSSSVVALDIATGQVKWHFQTVHHDLWDYDVPAQPTLVDLTIAGQNVPALVQPTKQGELYVLDRRTGQPLLPVTEQPAPQGAAQGDRTAATQPVSALSFDPPPLTPRSMWGATLFDQLACRIHFHQLRYEGRYTPPSTGGSLIYPGNFGVFNWGGIAVDPVRQVAFTTPTYLAFVSTLIPRQDDTTTYVQGKEAPHGMLPKLNENFGAPFAVKLHPFTSPLGIPCQAPPWGYVAGADLTSGRIAWRHRNGTVRDITPLPLPFRMGVPNIGGPIVTAGGVAFLTGTIDNFVRAYDVTSGRQLWEDRLPAGGQATPMTYQGDDGRQYLLVVAGGHGSLGTKAGDHVIAYALPK